MRVSPTARAVVLAVAALPLLAGSGAAGTEEAPEIQSPRGSTVVGSAPCLVTPLYLCDEYDDFQGLQSGEASSAADLVKVWFENETEGIVRITLHVDDLSGLNTSRVPVYSGVYVVYFHSNVDTYHLAAVSLYPEGGQRARMTTVHPDGASTLDSVEGWVDWDASRVGLRLTFNSSGPLIAGSRLSNLSSAALVHYGTEPWQLWEEDYAWATAGVTFNVSQEEVQPGPPRSSAGAEAPSAGLAACVASVLLGCAAWRRWGR